MTERIFQLPVFIRFPHTPGLGTSQTQAAVGTGQHVPSAHDSLWLGGSRVTVIAVGIISPVRGPEPQEAAPRGLGRVITHSPVSVASGPIQELP